METVLFWTVMIHIISENIVFGGFKSA